MAAKDAQARRMQSVRMTKCWWKSGQEHHAGITETARRFCGRGAYLEVNYRNDPTKDLQESILVT